jgi:hypothetical protein
MDHPAATEPVFTPRRLRRLGLANLLASAASVPLTVAVAIALAVALGPLVGGGPALLAACAAAGLLTWWTYDHLCLGPFNRRLRRDLRRRLEALGELRFDTASPDCYFVGLAYPHRAAGAALRWESDDDVGFLRLDFDSLAYHGDRLAFEVDYDQLAEVRLEPLGLGLPRSFVRLRLTFVAGAPVDELLLVCREGDRLTRANRATRVFCEALEQRRARHSARRLTGVESDRQALSAEREQV